MPNIGTQAVEEIHYEWYDTLEVNLNTQNVVFFATPQGQLSNLSGVQKTEAFTNLSNAGQLPSSETFNIMALRIQIDQYPGQIEDNAGKVFPFDQIVKAIMGHSSFRLTVQNKEYLTMKTIFVGAGCGVDVRPALAVADPLVLGLQSAPAATNGNPSNGNVYVLSKPIPLNDQEPFRVAMQFDPALMFNFLPASGPQAAPPPVFRVTFSLAGILTRPIQ